MKCKNCPCYPENRGSLVLRNVIACPCTWCHTPEDSNRQAHHSDNLRYSLFKIVQRILRGCDEGDAPAQRRVLRTVPLCGKLMLFMDIFLRWCEIGDFFLILDCVISPCGQHVWAFDPPDTVTGDVRCHYNWQSPCVRCVCWCSDMVGVTGVQWLLNVTFKKWKLPPRITLWYLSNVNIVTKA